MTRESTFLGGDGEKEDYQNKYLYLEIYTQESHDENLADISQR